MRKTVCPLTNKPFNCKDCDWIDKSGKCLYMKADDFVEKSFKTIRKQILKEIMNEKSRS